MCVCVRVRVYMSVNTYALVLVGTVARCGGCDRKWGVDKLLSPINIRKIA